MIHHVLIGVLYVGMLALSVLIHEYGHTLAYRLLGTKVEVIAVGFGPKLLRYTDRQGTEWSLRPILLGGFVKAPYNDYLRPSYRGIAAMAGPVGSMLLGSLAFTIYTVWQNEHVLWLGYLNATMAIFNLLPFLPLDGGRIFLAWLEAKKGKLWLKPREDFIAIGGFALVWLLMFLVLPLSNWKMFPPPREKIVEKIVEKESHLHTGGFRYVSGYDMDETDKTHTLPENTVVYYVTDEWQEGGYKHYPQNRTHPIKEEK